jgi:uncharacterized protein
VKIDTLVNNSNNPLQLNVGYLYNKPIGTSREVPVDFYEIQIDDILVRELESTVRTSRTREGLLLQVSAKAKVETTCVRCLDTFFLPVEVQFEELYQFPSRHREETDLILPQDGYIDLNLLYREYLILAMPIKRLCRKDCKGLCMVCGANLNETTCEHHQKPKPPIELQGEKAS